MAIQCRGEEAHTARVAVSTRVIVHYRYANVMFVLDVSPSLGVWVPSLGAPLYASLLPALSGTLTKLLEPPERCVGLKKVPRGEWRCPACK